MNADVAVPCLCRCPQSEHDGFDHCTCGCPAYRPNLAVTP